MSYKYRYLIQNWIIGNFPSAEVQVHNVTQSPRTEIQSEKVETSAKDMSMIQKLPGVSKYSLLCV